MKVIGLTSGIGSMLIGAKKLGFDVVGNIEWRTYYHQKDKGGHNTFLENYPGAFMVKRIGDLTTEQREAAYGADLAMGHPECGSYSQMNSVNKPKFHDAGDIPLFVELVATLKPRFFVMDDLPKSFIAFSMEEYAKRLPEYDLFPEWISNYHYGNIQKNRRRMFMIGALKTEKFVFRPGEFDHDKTVAEVIGDLYGHEGEAGIPNHDVHTTTGKSGRAKDYLYRGHEATWSDVIDWALKQKPGACFRYHSPAGYVKPKPGFYRGHWDGPAHVLDGGSPAIHHHRGLPYTIRERARIQGFPDDFVFYGTKYDEKGEWCHEKNTHMVKQTGKAMPIQFCTFVADQIAHHIRGEPFQYSDERFNKPDPYVDQAKSWWCHNVGYADQYTACTACWMNHRCDKSLVTTTTTDPGILLPDPSPRREPKPRQQKTVQPSRTYSSESVTLIDTRKGMK